MVGLVFSDIGDRSTLLHITRVGEVFTVQITIFTIQITVTFSSFFIFFNGVILRLCPRKVVDSGYWVEIFLVICVGAFIGSGPVVFYVLKWYDFTSLPSKCRGE